MQAASGAYEPIKIIDLDDERPVAFYLLEHRENCQYWTAKGRDDMFLS